VDLWQVHSVKSDEDLQKIFAPGGAIEAFEAAKKAGKCRFIGFTGHHDPAAHLEMLRSYDKFDTILMPLNPADPSYLSFEKDVLPEAVKQGLGVQGMKSLANAKLLQSFSVKQCLNYVLSLPIHCLAVGATTLGQIEDDARIAREFEPYSESRMAELRKTAQALAGPQLEDWKRNTQTAQNGSPAREYTGG
jgi:predicted aldo/keto reductase-like oxidoreductase